MEKDKKNDDLQAGKKSHRQMTQARRGIQETAIRGVAGRRGGHLARFQVRRRTQAGLNAFGWKGGAWAGKKEKEEPDRRMMGQLVNKWFAQQE